MINSDISLLVSKLKVVLSARGFQSYNDAYLQFEIEQAISEINRCRRFVPDKNRLYDDKYEYLIIPMCIAAIAKIGAEGQISHSENGVLRNYGTSIDYPKELISQIIPLIK